MYIDDIRLPESIDTMASLQNFDTQKRTVSNRLITKLSPHEKWLVTVKFSTETLSLDFQKRFYEKCLQMRSTAKQITFISPYTGEDITITAKCTSRTAPAVLSISKGRPLLYKNIEAVFEEV